MRNLAKLILFAGLFAGLFAVTGCATQKALDKTQPGIRWNKNTQKDEALAGNPAYYGAVPFAFAFDVATAPLWGPFVLYFAYSMSQPPTPPPAPELSVRPQKRHKVE